MAVVIHEKIAWLEAFNDRAAEAAMLADQNIKIAACVAAANLILNHPDMEKHKIKDNGDQVRHQTVPVSVAGENQIVVGSVFKAPSLRTIPQLVAAGRLRQQSMYTREIDESGEPDIQPSWDHPYTAILPSDGVQPNRAVPHDIVDGSFSYAPYMDDHIKLFGQHVALIADALDIALPDGNEFVGVTRAARLR